jgi:hypothetical protein
LWRVKRRWGEHATAFNISIGAEANTSSVLRPVKKREGWYETGDVFFSDATILEEKGLEEKEGDQGQLS